MRPIILFLLGCLISCSQPDQRQGSNSFPSGSSYLFELLHDSLSLVDFRNQVVETSSMNALNYDYMYNGAGVSVGDFNADGWVDLFFAGNQVENGLFLNKGKFQFEDVSEVSGLIGQAGFYTGSTVVDINADGRLDLYLCKSGAYEDPDQRRNELYVNQGNDANGVPIFKEEAKRYKLDLPHYSTQATFFDYDRDGDLDLFLINHNVNTQIHYQPLRFQREKLPETSDRLFRNDQQTFVDVSVEAGLLNDGLGFGLGLAIGDINNDQWPDVIVGQDFKSKDRVYLNQKDGTFSEISHEATGHISHFSMGNDLADIDNDGWLDFMSLDMVSEDNYGIKASMSGMNPARFSQMLAEGLHYQYMYNTLQLNSGVLGDSLPHFSEIAAMAGVSSTDWSWGPLFFDMDNDGDKDLFVSNGILRDFRNVDYIHYRERAEIAYLAKVEKASPTLKALMSKEHDANLIRRMPPRKKDNYFYENNGKLGFVKRNTQWAREKLDASNGAAYADLDNDGDLDLVTNNLADLAGIYRNYSREKLGANFLRISLIGPPQNPMGIGTRVEVKTGAQTQTQELYVSRGFQSSVEPILHFGLGQSKKVDHIHITWPDGKQQLISATPANQVLVLHYADANPAPKRASSPKSGLFSDITAASQLHHFSAENEFNDFERESLLPHKMSEEGPAVAVGDVNQDGLEDLYLTGAKGHSGRLYLQQKDATFKPSEQLAFRRHKASEEVDAVFFDADSDGDLDLYVVCGGNEAPDSSPLYQDHFYLNEQGNFRLIPSALGGLPSISGSVARPYDYDQDGDLDLFVGNRQVPGKYPFSGSSQLLRNDSEREHIRFSLAASSSLDSLGMVTDALWCDLTQDGRAELVVVGEWSPIRVLAVSKSGEFEALQTGLSHSAGWWFSLQAEDFDQDGDLDLMVGNLGRNAKYQASSEEPFEIFVDDFDATGNLDIVLGYHQDGKRFPLRGRECSSNQMPYLKEKFPTYHAFALAALEEVYGQEKLQQALHYRAERFETVYLENLGQGQFQLAPLPPLAQISSTREFLTGDFNADGHLDALLFGNTYGFEVETPRQDASYGVMLQGDGQGQFRALPAYESGLYVNGQVAGAAQIKLANGKQAYVLAKTQEPIQLIGLTPPDG